MEKEKLPNAASGCTTNSPLCITSIMGMIVGDIGATVAGVAIYTTSIVQSCLRSRVVSVG